MFYDHRHPEPLERVIFTLGYFSRKFKPSLQSYVPATEFPHLDQQLWNSYAFSTSLVPQLV